MSFGFKAAHPYHLDICTIFASMLRILPERVGTLPLHPAHTPLQKRWIIYMDDYNDASTKSI